MKTNKNGKIKFYANITILIFAWLMLAGCAGITSDVPADYILIKDSSKGLIALSITFEKIPYVENLGFAFRNYEKNFKSNIAVLDMSMKEYWTDYYSEKERGRLVLVELDPGEYEFYSWSGGIGGFGGARTINSTQEFSKKFSVTAGKITYIGNMHLTVSGIGKVAIDEVGSYSVIARDRRDMDVPAIFSKWPALDRNALSIEIMQSDHTDTQ